jgi:hypothetical protein
MKKNLTKLTLNRETVRLIHVSAGLLQTLAPGCHTGVGQCGPSSPPATCPPA